MVDFAKPGPEHERLRRLTGAWTARIKYFPAPDAPPVESTGQYLAGWTSAATSSAAK